MPERPQDLPRWAMEDQIDETSGQLNVVEPPEARKDSGWDRREIPPRQWFNWLARKTAKWVEWLDSRVSVADTYTQAELPSTTDIGRVALVTDIPALAYFDGADWRRADNNEVII